MAESERVNPPVEPEVDGRASDETNSIGETKNIDEEKNVDVAESPVAESSEVSGSAVETTAEVEPSEVEPDVGESIAAEISDAETSDAVPEETSSEDAPADAVPVEETPAETPDPQVSASGEASESSSSETVQPESATDAPAESEDTSDLAIFEKYLEEDLDFDLPGRGDLREGVIVEIRPSEWLVNVGGKRDGVVPQSDLARLDPEFVKTFSVGGPVDVVVSRQPDDDGIFLLSISEALQRKDWITAQELLESGEITTHVVDGYNKGGLTVIFNHLRGFVPASHVVNMPRNLSEEERRVALASHIGTEKQLKVIEVERRRRRLVMSESLALRELQAGMREELFETIQVGDVLSGEVRSMRPFGAFVDVGGADGLLHVSEIGWAQVDHPRDVLKIGEKIDVEVIRVDQERQRIALSRKRLLPNPWDSVDERYAADDIVTGKITRVVDFGAFAQLEPGVEGLVHISELADSSVPEPLKAVQVGDEVKLKVLRVDSRRQRIGLSRRQVEEATQPTIEQDWAVREPEPDTQEIENEGENERESEDEE